MKYEMHRVTSFLIERFSKNIYLNIMNELNSNNDDIINLVKYNIKNNHIEWINNKGKTNYLLLYCLENNEEIKK